MSFGEGAILLIPLKKTNNLLQEYITHALTFQLLGRLGTVRFCPLLPKSNEFAQQMPPQLFTIHYSLCQFSIALFISPLQLFPHLSVFYDWQVALD